MLFLEADFVEVVVDAAEGEQFVVAALFDDLTLVHDQNLVGVDDGGEAVGDNKRGAAL